MSAVFVSAFPTDEFKQEYGSRVLVPDNAPPEIAQQGPGGVEGAVASAIAEPQSVVRSSMIVKVNNITKPNN